MPGTSKGYRVCEHFNLGVHLCQITCMAVYLYIRLLIWYHQTSESGNEYFIGKPYTTISCLSVQQSKLSPRGAVDDSMALLHEAEGRGEQYIGSSTAPRM